MPAALAPPRERPATHLDVDALLGTHGGAPRGKIDMIGYIRVSTAREDMISPDIQADAIHRWARKHGRRIVRWIADLDLTGRNFNRKIIEGIAAIERREAKEIGVWKYSRFGRNRALGAVNLARLETAGGQLESATENVDARTSLGRFTRDMLMSVAQLQSDQISESWKDVHALRLSRGLPNNGRRRLGYMRLGRIEDPLQPGVWVRDPHDTEGERYLIDPDTGPILAEMYERAAAGESGYSICRWLNDEQVPGPMGRVGAWTHSTLWPLLDSGFGAGLLRVHDPKCVEHDLDKQGWCRNRTWIEGAHTAVIDDGETAGPTWQAYRARRTEAPTVPPNAREPKHELTRAIECDRCGRIMVAHRNTSRYRRLDTYAWVCKGQSFGTCETTNSVSDRMIRAAFLDILTAEADRLAAIEAEAGHHEIRARAERQERDRAAEIDAELAKVERALDRLTERYAEDEIPRDAYERTRDRYLDSRAKLSQERAALDAAKKRPKQPVDFLPVVRGLLDEWTTLGVPERNRLLRELVSIRARRESRTEAHVTISTAWGTTHKAPAAERMGRPVRKDAGQSHEIKSALSDG